MNELFKKLLFYSMDVYFSSNLAASADSSSVSLVSCSLVLNVCSNPFLRASIIISGVIMKPSWLIEVIFSLNCCSVLAWSGVLKHCAFNSGSKFNRIGPCWRILFFILLWADPEIFFPLTSSSYQLELLKQMLVARRSGCCLSSALIPSCFNAITRACAITL